VWASGFLLLAVVVIFIGKCILCRIFCPNCCFPADPDAGLLPSWRAFSDWVSRSFSRSERPEHHCHQQV
jgi:hypothetical protein